MDYQLRSAVPEDRGRIYALRAASIRPYVQRYWGWDEDYQRNDFERDFSSIDSFHIIQVDGSFAGFVQHSLEEPCCHIAELHLLPEYRGRGIGTDILRSFQTACSRRGRTVRIGCFLENAGARKLYQKCGFRQTAETATHVIFEYGSVSSCDLY